MEYYGVWRWKMAMQVLPIYGVNVQSSTTQWMIWISKSREWRTGKLESHGEALLAPYMYLRRHPTPIHLPMYSIYSHMEYPREPLHVPTCTQCRVSERAACLYIAVSRARDALAAECIPNTEYILVRGPTVGSTRTNAVCTYQVSRFALVPVRVLVLTLAAAGDRRGNTYY